MAKLRIHDLVKEIDPESKTLTGDIVKFLQDRSGEAKTHASSVTDEEAETIRHMFGKGAEEKVKAAAADETVKKPANAPDNAARSARPDDPQQRRTQGAPNGSQGMRQTIKLRIGGELVECAVAKDKGGRLYNIANNKFVPFRMRPDGNIEGDDGKVLMRRPPQNQQNGKQPQNVKNTNSTAGGERERKPMNQVFDGRSEKDKRMAQNAGQNRSSHGSLADALGDRILDLKSQLKPVSPEDLKPAPPKVKKVIPDPPKPDWLKNPQPAEESKPVQQPVAAAEQQDNSAKSQDTLQGEEKSVREERPVREDRSSNDRQGSDRPQGEKKPYGDRPQGERTQGDRPSGERKPYGDRPQGERRPYGDRPQGERRPYGDRHQGERRPYGDGQQGERRPYGDRPQGERRPYGDRPSGERKPYGDGQQGERRPYGDRPSGERRPYGDRPSGDRPSFNRDGARPGYQGNQRGGAPSAFGGKDKDEDQRRTFTRKADNRPSGGSIKSELANELGKGQRAESLKDRKRDKNDKRDRSNFDEDGVKNGKTKKDPNRKGAFIKPVAKPQEKQEDDIKTIVIPEVITIKELADKMKQPSAAIIKKLFLGGKMVNLNSEITFEEAEEIALEYEIICEKEVKVNMVEELLKDTEEDPETLVKRPPVVCVMGHVDHGKTSLLDAIRSTNVTSREAGGITQHIGAYMVEIEGRKITFLDTPGHEAFTSMRMRGAKSTDIAILVIAADDGVMPQTIEAINHAKAANVSIIVAVNKIDKPGANIDRVKQELTEHGLVAEDWGGETVFVPVSAKTHEGIENLLEMVLLTADVMELKANPNRRARGIVIESKLDIGRGPVATVLIQKGTLNVGDNIAIGATYGKVRAMIDDKGRRIKTATPSTPVEILGLNGVPQAGEVIISVADEKEARTIAEAFITQSKEQLVAESKKSMSLDSLFSQIQAGEVKELNLIVKADVMGSVEAVKQSLVKLSNEEVVVRVIHGGVGNINESDVNLASASNAIIIGFNVKPDNTAKEISEREKIDIKLYRVIYDAINDIESAMKGMLKPVYEERVIAHAEVRMIFKASGVGNIAGSFVLDGKIERGCSARITREGKQIFDGALASLKRFKDDVKEVAAGYECGLVFEKFSDLAELDQVEFYKMVEVPRT